MTLPTTPSLNSARLSEIDADEAGSGSPRSHKVRREVARTRILDAAYQIVAEGGLDRLTLQGAGEAAGYSRALPGHYFGSKEDLICALGEAIQNSHVSHLARLDAGEGGLPSLLAAITYYLAEPQNDNDTIRAFHSFLGASLTKPVLGDTVRALNQAAAQRFRDLILQGQARGQIRTELDADLQARLIAATLRGLVVQWLQSPDSFSLNAARDLYLDQIARTLAP